MATLHLCSKLLLLIPFFLLGNQTANAFPWGINIPVGFTTGYGFSITQGAGVSATSNAATSVLRGFGGTNVAPVTDTTVTVDTPVRVINPSLPFNWAVQDTVQSSENTTLQQSTSLGYGANLSVFQSQ